VERIFFGVDRLPIAARGGAEDMIGYLDMVIAEVFGGLPERVNDFETAGLLI
jgi:hypothetical protein